MKKVLAKKLFSSLGALVWAVALTGVSTQSIWFFYEPDVPESLKSRGDGNCIDG